jgi:hypothetical protein
MPADIARLRSLENALEPQEFFDKLLVSGGRFGANFFEQGRDRPQAFVRGEPLLVRDFNAGVFTIQNSGYIRFLYPEERRERYHAGLRGEKAGIVCLSDQTLAGTSSFTASFAA